MNTLLAVIIGCCLSIIHIIVVDDAYNKGFDYGVESTRHTNTQRSEIWFGEINAGALEITCSNGVLSHTTSGYLSQVVK